MAPTGCDNGQKRHRYKNALLTHAQNYNRLSYYSCINIDQLQFSGPIVWTLDGSVYEGH